MIRFAIAAALALLLAAPAVPQTITGCSSVPVNRIETSTDRTKLAADIACLERVKVSATNSIARRQSRLTKLDAAPATPKPPAVPTGAPAAGSGDAVEPEPDGASPTKIPAPIASNIDVAAWLTPGDRIPPKELYDVVGSFRFICLPGQVGSDDPIVFPGQPGKSHLHQFFGNTGANARSTYASLRTTGDSTCGNQLNRSAYWIPAMLDGLGFVRRPDYVSIYYKRRPDTDPLCKVQGIACVALPRGLRFIFGYDMVSGKQKTGAGYFNCSDDSGMWSTGHHADIASIAMKCGPGPNGERRRLGAIITAPDCWDGKRLDSPNHRDHVAYASYGMDGVLRCPAANPYIIPTFTLGAWYDVGTIAAGQPGSVATWSLSSDDMTMDGKVVRMTAGSTLHADWDGAWDDTVMAAWTDNCINKLLNCNGGELGNGMVLKPQFAAADMGPKLMPIPARGQMIPARP
ncbi:DUF1996 domain-containing protein [Sphingomonas sp. BK235]|uniref:DUF1996 domain-containing protein n=1 Tax=Sphingomonas sp. BK235 TaxID=2512131 RepID=UPI00104708BB|nr:DUF1996 domain-containing protein [Sphingomonas sp. BK235]TCP36563.1 uncharacterized protein DUF1996 [Sphingomonas sp. BK235]